MGITFRYTCFKGVEHGMFDTPEIVVLLNGIRGHFGAGGCRHIQDELGGNLAGVGITDTAVGVQLFLLASHG